MSGPDLPFDFRDLPAAAADSCFPLPPFCGDFLERASVRLELGFLSGQRLPPLDDHIDVLWIQFDAATDSLRQFRAREGCAAAQERLVYQFPTFQVVENRATHQFNGF